MFAASAGGLLCCTTPWCGFKEWLLLGSISTHTFSVTLPRTGPDCPGKGSDDYWTQLMVMLSVGSLSNGSFQQALKSSVGSLRTQAVQPYAH